MLLSRLCFHIWSGRSFCGFSPVPQVDLINKFIITELGALSGPIPDLSALTSLQIIALGMNQLSGAIPDLSTLSGLQRLFLDNNQLTGSIPASVCQATEWLALDYNKLEIDTADYCVDTIDPDWKESQTIPPTNVTMVTTSATNIQLTWDAIAYTEDGGYYGVWGKVQGEPTYTLMATTADKTSTGATVSGLRPGTTYEFVIRTFTPAHGDQQNDLTSGDSEVVTAVTDIFSLYLPFITDPSPFEPITINDVPIPDRSVVATGEIFYSTTVSIGANLPPGGTFYMSAAINTPTAAGVDDEVVILLNGTELFSHIYGQPGGGVPPALVEVPHTVMDQLAGKTVAIEFRDVYGKKVAATTLYLIWSP